MTSQGKKMPHGKAFPSKSSRFGRLAAPTRAKPDGTKIAICRPWRCFLTEYRRALETCDAPGVVADALRDLELIQAAGIEGLEPVFELLRTTDGEIHDGALGG